jgi:hypothetical protein
VEGIKRPEDLQDKDILMALDKTRGVGVQWGDFISYKKGDTPINFIARVKGEYSAWYRSKEAEEASKVRASQVSSREPDQRPDASRETSEASVLPAKRSLDAILEAQEIAATVEYAHLTQRSKNLEAELKKIDGEIRKIKLELDNVRRFRAELSAGTSPIPSEMGKDIHREVGQRKPRRSRRLGAESDPEVGKQSSQGGDAKDTGSSERAKPTEGIDAYYAQFRK